MDRITYYDKIYLLLAGLTLFLSFAAIGWNHYHENYYLDFQWANIAQGTLPITLFSLCYIWLLFKKNSPKLFIFKSVILLFISICVLETMYSATLTTPFPTHDLLFKEFNELIGFHFIETLVFIKNQRWLLITIWLVYLSLLLAIHCLPIMLALIDTESTVYHFFASYFIACIIGGLVFYFYPTATSPAAVYPKIYFEPLQLKTLQAFIAEHAHLPVHFTMTGGFISFPSFHATWAFFVGYYLYKQSFLKVFAIVYPALVMITAVLTGWHYVADIIAGIVVAAISLQIATYLIYPSKKHSKSQVRIYGKVCQ